MKPFLFTLLIILGISMPSFAATTTKSAELSGITEKGLVIEIYSELSPLLINQIHSWHIRIRNANDQVVSVEQLTIIGGMPEHDHGLPTQPQITAQLENGDYLLEGVRFHMPGKWELVISMSVDGQVDQALIEFQL